MMRRYTLIAVCLLASLLVAACSSTAEAPVGPQDTEPAAEVAAQATSVEEPAAEAAETVAPAESTEAPAVQESEAVEVATAEPVQAAQPTPAAQPTTEPPTATAAPQFNGEYEETFYRGLATAPITMIDYSDFL